MPSGSVADARPPHSFRAMARTSLPVRTGSVSLASAALTRSAGSQPGSAAKPAQCSPLATADANSSAISASVLARCSATGAQATHLPRQPLSMPPSRKPCPLLTTSRQASRATMIQQAAGSMTRATVPSRPASLRVRLEEASARARRHLTATRAGSSTSARADVSIRSSRSGSSNSVGEDLEPMRRVGVDMVDLCGGQACGEVGGRLGAVLRYLPGAALARHGHASACPPRSARSCRGRPVRPGDGVAARLVDAHL